jgi:hypothetical protein
MIWTCLTQIAQGSSSVIAEVAAMKREAKAVKIKQEEMTVAKVRLSCAASICCRSSNDNKDNVRKRASPKRATIWTSSLGFLNLSRVMHFCGWKYIDGWNRLLILNEHGFGAYFQILAFFQCP